MWRCVIPRADPHLLLRRRRWISSTSSSPVDHSFTSKHVSSDGRVFLFATVVVNKMGKGQSALPAWQHACSLVKANPPTLAIAFLSKPTDSALAAVSDLAQQFSLYPHDVGGPCHDHGSHPNASSKAGHMDLSRHSCHGSDPDALLDAGHKDPVLHSHEYDATTSACNTPIIYDNHENVVRSDQSLSCFTNSLTSTSTMPYENAQTHVEPQLASIPPLIGCIVADQGRVALTTSIVRANVETSDDLLWLEAPDDKGDVSDAGSGAGDGGFGSDDRKSGVVEGNSGGGDGASHCQAPNMQILSNNILEDELWKPSKRSFYIKITESNTSSSSSGVLRQRQEQLVGVSSGKDKFSPISVDIQDDVGRKKELFDGKKVACEGEVGGSCTSQPLDEHRTDEDNKKSRNSHAPVEEEETYMLSLCVANMPGVKATGFYSRTTRLPWLPDLKNAVTTNHPHMVLLGAPGFNLVEFGELLARMFRNGSSDAVCKSLFLPQRNKVEWLNTWQRAYKVKPDSVRDKIHTKLLSKNLISSRVHLGSSQDRLSSLMTSGVKMILRNKK